MLDQRMKERIMAEETSRFMDGNFGQLDLSGSPDLTTLLRKTSVNCRIGMASTE
jgi:hypothetical protein